MKLNAILCITLLSTSSIIFSSNTQPPTFDPDNNARQTHTPPSRTETYTNVPSTERPPIVPCLLFTALIVWGGCQIYNYATDSGPLTHCSINNINANSTGVANSCWLYYTGSLPSCNSIKVKSHTYCPIEDTSDLDLYENVREKIDILEKHELCIQQVACPSNQAPCKEYMPLTSLPKRVITDKKQIAHIAFDGTPEQHTKIFPALARLQNKQNNYTKPPYIPHKRR